MTAVDTTVNGVRVVTNVAPRLTLAEFLREELGLYGTKVSCELQVCGVCTVLVDNLPVSACTYLTVDTDGHDVTSIEGVAESGDLHPVQQAFVDEFAMQCGFCTPGFVMMTIALLQEQPDPSREEIEQYLDGNICRCTGYRPIIDAIGKAATRVVGTHSGSDTES